MRIIRNELSTVTKAQTKLLCEALWSWQFCSNCTSNTRCNCRACPGQRLSRLTLFFQYYRELAGDYCPVLKPGESAVIRNHEDMAAILKLVRLNPEIVRSAMRNQLIDERKLELLSLEDVDVALNLAVRVLLMFNCSAEAVTPDILEQGPDHVCWRDGESLCELVEEAFQSSDNFIFGSGMKDVPMRFAPKLTARKLKKRIGIDFVPTSNVRNHLRYDRRANVVELYHHTSLMKEHLRLTKNEGALSTADALQLGALPRQIALEVIDSIQQLLFPLTDPKSFSMLRKLVSKHTMDPDCLRYDSVAIRNDDEAEVPYLYFGSRLADLYEELEHPRPRGLIEKWLERKSGARHAMLATLAGVIFAIALGAAALAISVVQTYISYQAWKHPVLTS